MIRDNPKKILLKELRAIKAKLLKRKNEYNRKYFNDPYAEYNQLMAQRDDLISPYNGKTWADVPSKVVNKWVELTQLAEKAFPSDEEAFEDKTKYLDKELDYKAAADVIDRIISMVEHRAF